VCFSEATKRTLSHYAIFMHRFRCIGKKKVIRDHIYFKNLDFSGSQLSICL
jgi:hypothetical protein